MIFGKLRILGEQAGVKLDTSDLLKEIHVQFVAILHIQLFE
jgi:hypothetical protein